MKQLYLVLAIIGAAGPYLFFVQHFAAAGWSLAVFVEAAFANPAAAGATTDLLLSSVVFWVYLLASADGRRAAVLLIPVNLLIGLSCALPLSLYLWERERVASAATV